MGEGSKRSELWQCPYCGLIGQTYAGDPYSTNLDAHLRVVRCHEDAAKPRELPS